MKTTPRLAHAAKLRTLVAGITLFAASTPAALMAADLEAGKASAALCVACHQADGTGMAVPNGEPWPALAGMDAGYLLKQLQDFKAGARTNASMQPFAQMLNDEQMRNVAAYYASLPPRAGTPSQASAELLAHGEKLALRGDWDRYVVACVSCHGPGNGGVGSDFPRIAGQLPEYIKAQLIAYRDGSRANDPIDLMSAIAQRMTDHDIEAVSAWLGTQSAPNSSRN